MSDLPAFRKLQRFIAEQTAPKPRQQPKKPESANALTRRIIAHIRQHGGYATRLSSTGTYREDLQKFVPSQQQAGLPDVLAVFEGQAVFVEIKVGRDQLSRDQRQTISDLQAARANVFVAHSFDAFRDWFTAEFLTPPFA